MPVLRLAGVDPYRNLAIEEELLETADQRPPTLLLWCNRRCVVIGRHQNPWLECDAARMQIDGVDLVRRISGGGAVFHDEGNTNFSFIAPRTQYDQSAQFRVVLDALRSLGFEARLSDRNDLLLGTRKFSGSAFRHSRGGSLHHGTILVAADLERLRAYLSPPSTTVETSAIESVRARVVNLCEARSDLTHRAVCDAIEREFARRYDASPLPNPMADTARAARIRSRAATLAGWEWRYGMTPTFSRTIHVDATTLALEVRRGVIAAVTPAAAHGEDDRAYSAHTGGDAEGLTEGIAEGLAEGLARECASLLAGVRYDSGDIIRRARTEDGRRAEVLRSVAKEIDAWTTVRPDTPG